MSSQNNVAGEVGKSKWDWKAMAARAGVGVGGERKELERKKEHKFDNWRYVPGVRGVVEVSWCLRCCFDI